MLGIDGDACNEFNSLIVRGGQLLGGCLNKDFVGRGKKNLISFIYEVIGPDGVRLFMTGTNRVTINTITMSGFTVGIGDVHVCARIKERLNSNEF